MRKSMIMLATSIALLAMGGCSSVPGAKPTSIHPTFAATQTSMAKVPDVTSFGRETAYRAIRAAGFTAVSTGLGGTDEGLIVKSQDPAAGTNAPSGSVVTVTLAKPAPVGSAIVQKIKQAYPGYPLIVDVGSIDRRVSSMFNTNGLSRGRVVAVAPGVYAPFNPAVPDLDFYIDNSPVDGDCVAIRALFPNAGSTCWDGVYPGSQEPTE